MSEPVFMLEELDQGDRDTPLEFKRGVVKDIDEPFELLHISGFPRHEVPTYVLGYSNVPVSRHLVHDQEPGAVIREIQLQYETGRDPGFYVVISVEEIFRRLTGCHNYR